MGVRGRTTSSLPLSRYPAGEQRHTMDSTPRTPAPAMRHLMLWLLAGAAAIAVAGFGTRRVFSDRTAIDIETLLFAVSDPLAVFSPTDLGGLPEPALRYLRHAIAPGTPLSPACRLWMNGTVTPMPGTPPTALSAVETLAPRQGFIWSARARMKGLPVRVRDHYYQGEGGVNVLALGIVPLPLGGGPDVIRSSRGRLVGEGVWCPTALVHPDVVWEGVDANRARFTISVDGEAVAVTILVGPDGALREATLLRWGDVEGKPSRLLPYGFRVEEERTFEGVTIPARITGGWLFGTDRFDPATAATFTVRNAAFAT